MRALLLLLLSFPVLLAQAQERLVATVPVVSGLERPTAIAHAGDGSGRLFVLEQPGRVRILDNGVLLETPFLDISDRVSCCGERGLLGIAFHPDYAANGEFYVNYTNASGTTIVARMLASDSANLADPGSETVLLEVEQPFSNHNGGHLAFGPDGYLYIGLGDGGSAGDPLSNGQDRLSLLGKMLRVDVEAGAPYAIPPDNPFAMEDFTLDEIWALGLRNPFRFSFDRITGDLYIADVGQNAIEEINVHRANTPAGINYGWRLMEGSQCFNPASGCNDGSLTLPAFEYAHSQGRCSVTGGYVYRGRSIQRLEGDYVFGDFCSGEIFLATQAADSSWSQSVLEATGLQISSFGEDENAELYVAGIGGSVEKIVAPLRIAPASGVYLRQQMIDLSAVLRVANVTISERNAQLNGVNVSSSFDDCALAGTLLEGGRTLRCPGIPLELLEPGQHQFTLSLTLSDGSIVSDSVYWTVLDSSEP